MVKSLPCSAGLILGLGRSHMLRGSWAHKPQVRSLCFRAHPLQLLKPARSRAWALQQEKPLQWEAHAPQWTVAPFHHNCRKALHSNEESVQPKINKQINKIFEKQNLYSSSTSEEKQPWGNIHNIHKCLIISRIEYKLPKINSKTTNNPTQNSQGIQRSMGLPRWH